MSDLEKKLRQVVLPRGYNTGMLVQAADRIEELEADVDVLRSDVECHKGWREHNEVRAEAAEAKLRAVGVRDQQMIGCILKLLRENPWPTTDTRWQMVEHWADTWIKAYGCDDEPEALLKEGVL